MGSIDEAKAFYRSHLATRNGRPRGCSVEAIDALEARVGSRLPGAYRDFLLWMGDDKDGVFRGSEWFASDVAENTAYVPELLRENGLGWRPDRPVLAFFSHQGYMLAWFELPATEDDPRCYFFSEGSEVGRIECQQTFSEFLLTELRQVAGVPLRPRL